MKKLPQSFLLKNSRAQPPALFVGSAGSQACGLTRKKFILPGRERLLRNAVL
jgi:hypothetical protein